ncbi:MAG: BadF/BadG/BcrA/BcrD ATPase family protein [Thermodesulfovibrionales bacterium]
MSVVCGIDVGSAAVKIVLMNSDNNGEDRILYKRVRKIRSEDPKKIVNEVFSTSLEESGISRDGIDYISSTGEGYFVDFKTGHFFGMTAHARGAKYLCDGVRTVIDAGALHHRVILVDGRSKVLSYKMTGQCASCSGSFIENISRYLGITMEETGQLALKSKNPKPVSGICAVLAETDVINMVSQGIEIADILKGVFNLMAERLARMVTNLKANTPIVLTGGLGANEGFQESLKEYINKDSNDLKIESVKDSIYAGAIGASLLGAMRVSKIQKKESVSFGRTTSHYTEVRNG